MLAEIGSAGMLLILGESALVFVMSLVALGLVWASTVFIQIPLHHRLTHGYDLFTINRLVTTNRWRTFAWTVRGLCLGLLIIQKLR